MKRRIAALLLALVLPLQVTPAAAQQDTQTPPPGKLRWILGAAGAAVMLGAASIAREGQEGSVCAEKSCLMTVGGAAGGLLGYLLGADLDARARARWTPGERLSFTPDALRLGAVPQRLATSTEGLLVLTADGVTLVDAQHAGRSVLELPLVQDVITTTSPRLLIAATPAGVVARSLDGPAALSTLDSASVTALSAAGADGVHEARPHLLRRLRLSAGPASLEAAEESRAPAEGITRALVASADGNVLWAVVERRLEAHDARTLELLGTLELPGHGRSLGIDRSHGIIATGATGVQLIDLADPRAPAKLADLSGMRAAHGAATLAGRAYVAAGAQGLYVFDVADARAPRLIGVWRDLDFAADVRAANGSIYVLDRAGRTLYRIDPREGTAATNQPPE